MMNKRLMTAAGAAALLAAATLGSARAEGLYIGGNLGTPNYRSPVNGITGSGSGLGLKLYGGYSLTPNFAVEAGVFDLGHIDDASGKVNVRGIFADAVGTFEVAPKWSLLARGGVAEGRFTSSNGNDTSPALELGAGVQYDLSKQVALRAEYEHYHFTNAFDAKANVGEVSVGLKFGF